MTASEARTTERRNPIRRKAPRRSPLKDRPLRQPGQSLDERITKLWFDDGDTWFAVAVTATVMIFVAWYQWLTRTIPQPVVVTVFCAGAIAFSFARMLKIKRQVRELKLARDGERVVADALEGLKWKGAVVFHDLVGDGHNIDHVIVSRRGIITVETKTRSKFPDSRVIYNGKSISIDGFLPDRDPLVQAAAEARELQCLLKKSTGKRYPVRAAIVFPGWYVETTNGGKGSDIWVLNEKALASFVEHEPEVVSEEDFRLAAFHLSRLIRAGNDH